MGCSPVFNDEGARAPGLQRERGSLDLSHGAHPNGVKKLACPREGKKERIGSSHKNKGGFLEEKQGIFWG